MSGLLFTTEEWSEERHARVTDAICRIYDKEIGIPYYPFQIRMIRSEQMLDTYVSHGMPFGYNYWSYGMDYVQLERAYKAGKLRLALELVINTNPCIVYCIEENTMTENTMVTAHAGCGHNAFFANNYLFKQWTNPSGIVEYAAFAARYIATCEEKYGVDAVEQVLDAAHALAPHGVHRYKRPQKISLDEEKQRLRKRLEYEEKHHDPLMPRKRNGAKNAQEKRRGMLDEPMENILYFIEKETREYVPEWQREIVRIVYTFAQYFFSQRLTKAMNEGFATFVHYYVMRRLHEEKLISDMSWGRFIEQHTSLILQPDFDHPFFLKIGHNPYGISYAMFEDILRACTSPTEEDKAWAPYIAGRPWQEVMKEAIETCRDETFFYNYLSPKVIRDFRLFSVIGDSAHDHMLVTAVHRDDGYKEIRQVFASHYESFAHTPQIEVVGVYEQGDRTLELRHSQTLGRTLDEDDIVRTLIYAERLRGFPVELRSYNEEGETVFRVRVSDGSPKFYTRYPSEGVEIGRKK